MASHQLVHFAVDCFSFSERVSEVLALEEHRLVHFVVDCSFAEVEVVQVVVKEEMEERMDV